MENCQCIIILHGWCSSKEKWAKVKENLEKEGVKVIVPDLPGFKEETKLSQPWSLDNYVEWLENLIEDKIKAGNLSEPFFILGHSFGGRISLLFASKHPEKLRGLILVDSAGILSDDLKKRAIARYAPSLKKLSFLPGYRFFRKVFYKFIIRKTDYLYVDGALKETFKMTIERDLTPILSRIKTETLVIWGEKDKTTPLSHGKLMNEKIEGSKIEILRGVAHNPYLDCPEILAGKILDFIK